MSKLMDMPKESGYAAWLHYSRNSKVEKLPAWCRVIVVHGTDEVLQSAASELQRGLTSMFGQLTEDQRRSCEYAIHCAGYVPSASFGRRTIQRKRTGRSERRRLPDSRDRDARSGIFSFAR